MQEGRKMRMKKSELTIKAHASILCLVEGVQVKVASMNAVTSQLPTDLCKLLTWRNLYSSTQRDRHRPLGHAWVFRSTLWDAAGGIRGRTTKASWSISTR